MKKKESTVEDLRGMIDMQKLPRHIAIIMDGNGRWAQRRGMPRVFGHKRGAERVKNVVEQCRALGIQILTLYAFSDENWGRPREEVSFLMDMLGSYLRSEIDSMKKNGIRFRTIGRIERLPASASTWIEKARSETEQNSGMVLNLALSYGGRGEILQAIRRLQSAGGIPEELREEHLSRHLDTAGLPDPDLMIRTSGEQRISNFLLWQAAYAELYFTEVLWPDFDEKELLLSIVDYQKRHRRFGLTGEQLPQGVGRDDAPTAAESHR
ncbi:MAG: isoprenyl transferase [Nitrospirota bacterium]|nr:isoprenyl transferase [Nitrospirota bacterium]